MSRLIDPLLQAANGQLVDYNASYRDGVVTVPAAGNTVYPSLYDYFSYPFSICANSDILLLAAADAVLKITRWWRNLSDHGYGWLDSKFYASSADDGIYIYCYDRSSLNYLAHREQSSILLCKDKAPNDNFYQIKSVNDIKSMLGEETQGIHLAVIMGTTEYNPLVDVLSPDGQLVMITTNIDDVKLVCKDFTDVSLYGTKLISSKVVIVARKRSINNMPDESKIDELIDRFEEYMSTVYVPNTPLPEHVMRIILNLP